TPSPEVTATPSPAETETPSPGDTGSPSPSPTSAATCGNGVIDTGEDCDPNGGSATSCAAASNTSAEFICDAATCQCACPCTVEFVGTSGDLGVLDTGW